MTPKQKLKKEKIEEKLLYVHKKTIMTHRIMQQSIKRNIAVILNPVHTQPTQIGTQLWACNEFGVEYN